MDRKNKEFLNKMFELTDMIRRIIQTHNIRYGNSVYAFIDKAEEVYYPPLDYHLRKLNILDMAPNEAEYIASNHILFNAKEMMNIDYGDIKAIISDKLKYDTTIISNFKNEIYKDGYRKLDEIFRQKLAKHLKIIYKYSGEHRDLMGADDIRNIKKIISFMDNRTTYSTIDYFSSLLKSNEMTIDEFIESEIDDSTVEAFVNLVTTFFDRTKRDYHSGKKCNRKIGSSNFAIKVSRETGYRGFYNLTLSIKIKDDVDDPIFVLGGNVNINVTKSYSISTPSRIEIYQTLLFGLKMMPKKVINKIIYQLEKDYLNDMEEEQS